LATHNKKYNKILKIIVLTKIVLTNYAVLTKFIREKGFQYVLLGTYSEYIAPLWSYQLQNLAKKGVIFGAIVHDPVRDFVLGPVWWHRWSIACGYSFLREAFVHEPIQLDTVRPMPQLRTTVIPHGPYHFADPTLSRDEIREQLDLPLEAKVMLVFGHIRDNKNIDLILQALVNFPELYLVVAGKDYASGQRPASFYQELAEKLGVEQRCRWQIGFLSDEEVANLFNAIDLVLLTYNKTFRSASGVLNTATSYRKFCLASGGDSSLKSVIQKYDLGIWIEPDNLDAINGGILQWLNHDCFTGKWEEYFSENSWLVNAELVLEAFER
jgi:glycosyltransferase involved in cell wall biosynthesis